MFPKTIEELKQYCLDQGMPLEKMRFFIGENKFEPKCFGIFRDGEQIIVYKNKDNGSRAVRYQGYDEAEACRILYEKIQEEIMLRKKNGPTATARKNQSKSKLVAFVLIFALMIGFNYFNRDKHRQGYYLVNDALFYCINDVFYTYDDGWFPYSGAVDTFDDYYYDDYNAAYCYDTYDNYTPFEDTSYYESASSSSSDNSSVFDSWDSGDTDWGSDW